LANDAGMDIGQYGLDSSVANFLNIIEKMFWGSVSRIVELSLMNVTSIAYVTVTLLSAVIVL